MKVFARTERGLVFTPIIIAFAICACFTGCLKQNPVSSELNVNLLQNPSFTINGVFSLQSWNESADSLIRSSTDVPQNGGAYSVAITPGAGFVEGAIYQTIAAPAGSHVYNFSVWGKIQNAGGIVYINVLHYSPPSPPVIIGGPAVSSPAWQEYYATDTISANIGDSIRIGLEADSTALGRNGQAYFNNCSFKEMQ